jgi:hypothetical protein
MRPTSSRPIRCFLIFVVSILLSMAAPWVHAAPQSGWWWNPDESGRGFFIEIDEGWFFMSGYFYDSAGHATWLVTNDPMTEPMHYQGRLLAVSNGQSLVGDYRAPGAPSVAGTVTVNFSDDNHARLEWNDASILIERQPFESAQPATFTPFTGWWWDPAESGRGMSLELQGQHMFIGLYMYEEDGRPVWYVADAMMTTPTRFVAPLLQFANGQTMGGGYHPPTGPRTVGTLLIDFTAPDRATVTLSDDPPAKAMSLTKSGLSKVRKYQPQKEKARPQKRQRYFGPFRQIITKSSPNPTITTITGQLTWDQLDLDSSDLSALNGQTLFEIYTGRLDLTLTGTIDQGDEKCAVAGSGGQNISGPDGSLVLHADRTYGSHIDFDLPVTITACGITMTFPVPVLLRMNGKMEGTTLDGDVTGIGTGNTIEETHWHFIGGS